MATMQAPGAGLGGGDLGKRSRQAAVAAAVLLAIVAIVVPFLVHALQDRDPEASAVQQTSPQTTTATGRHHTSSGTSGDTTSDAALGSRGDLPSLLPAARLALRDGQPVRVGDVTTGVVHRSATAGWQVLVRWDGRLQPLPIRGPVSLGAATWASRAGLLYTRVATATPGRFHVYAWSPTGGTAYTPPTLVATTVGDVCFNQAFTAFGGCSQG